MAHKKYLPDLKQLFILLVVLFSLLTATINLDSVVPLWWDEGWTLSVARNWVLYDHYGQFNNGQPQSAGLSASYTVVAPIAFVFRLFGVGVFQGRIVGVVYTIVSLGLMYYLAKNLYNPTVAIGTLVVLLFLSKVWQAHPIFWGRQALGEMPSLFFLLAGYYFAFLALRKSLWLMVFAILFWGIGINMKLQVIPFWLLSLLFPLLVAFYKRWHKHIIVCLIGILFSSLFLWLLPILQTWAIGSEYLPKENLPGIYNITALVLYPGVRKQALEHVISYGIPVLLGLAYGVIQLRNLKKINNDIDVEIIRLSLLVLAGSWYAWYITFAIWWERYFFPPLFIGSIFLAHLLAQLTNQFDWRLNFQGLFGLIGRKDHEQVTRSLWIQRLLAVCIFMWIGISSTITVLELTTIVAVPDVSSPQKVAEYLNTQTPPDALIETYESDLFFFLNRRYHYPPNELQIDLQYPTYFGIKRTIKYDPLAVDPDYIVTGPYSDAIHKGIIYDPFIHTGAFRLKATFPAYKVYERVR